MWSRTIESLYEELVSEGIIVRPPKTSLTDYVGEYSFLGTTLRQANIEPMPSLSDVRRLVTEYTILPLGAATASFHRLHLSKGPFRPGAFVAAAVSGGQRGWPHLYLRGWTKIPDDTVYD